MPIAPGSAPIRRSLRGALLATLVGGGACGHALPLRERPPVDSLEHLLPDPEPSAHRLMAPVTIAVADGLTIDEAMALAVVTNPDLRAARAERGIARAQVVDARILPNPELSLGIDVPAFGSTAGESAAGRVGISWELTALVARNANVAAGDARVEQVQLDIAWQEWQVAVEARLQWRRIAATSNELLDASTTEREFGAVAATLERARASGDATAIEASAARSAAEEATLVRMAVERTHEQARRALNRALGLESGAAVVLQAVAEPDLGRLPARLDLAAGLPAHRLDLVALQLGYASAEQRVRAAVLSRIPRVALDVGLARDTSHVGTVGVGVTVALPIFDRGQGRIGIATATREQLQLEYDARVYSARAELDDAFAELAEARTALAVGESALVHVAALVDTYRLALAQHIVDVPSLYVAMSSLNVRRLDVAHRREEIGDLVTAIELASGQLVPSISPPAKAAP